MTDISAATHLPTLSAEGLSMHFGRIRLFRGLNLGLSGGESLAVTGPNGSGKSTLLKILAGVLGPDSGRIRLSIGHVTIKDPDRALNTGMVAPYLNAYDGLTARENLRFLARARLYRNADGRIDELLDFVGLGRRADDLVGTFSSGMKQRVKFAAALLAEPVLLLLDEPRSNLDLDGLEMLTRVRERWLDSGRLVLTATNDADEAERADHRISVADFR